MSFINNSVIACMLCVASCVFLACGNESYDTGDGSLSYLRADFVEANTDGNANVVSAVSDDGTTLMLSPSIKADWISARDSTYRALLYYDNVENATGSVEVRPIAIGRVLVPNIFKDDTLLPKTYPTDPVALETAWMSKSQKYINLGISVKTGRIDGKVEAQSFGILFCGMAQAEDGHRCFKLNLIHDQNNAPEYYSAQVYVSIPLYRFPTSVNAGDEFEISVNTYGGKVMKKFYLNQQ